jgi:hypothetical protein
VTRLRRSAGAWLGIIAAGLMACSSKQAEPLPPAESVVIPVPAAGPDTVLLPTEHELYDAAVARGAPEAVDRDPQEARALFDRLLELYPETVYADEVAWFTAFLDLEVAMRQQLRVLRAELEQLKAIDFGEEADPEGP